jgi:hypothetical protein
MAVRRIDTNGDWTFGQGKANYAIGAEEVLQNVITRIQSFKNDWFLDTEQCIDWLNILSNKNNKKIIEDEIERVTFSTPGVRSIKQLYLIESTKRSASVYLKFDTIYDVVFQQEIGIGI